MSLKSHFSSKTKLVYIFVLIFAVLGLVLLFYLTQSAKIETITEQDVERVSEVNDLESLMTKNKLSLEKAGRGGFQNVRAIDENDKVMANSQGEVEIVVYTDFDCQFCADTHKVLKQVQEEYGEKVSIAIRHFPMRQHVNSFLAAVATECAARENKFFEATDDFFLAVEEKKQNQEHINSLPTRLRLNNENFKNCLDDNEVNSFVTQQIQEARQFGVLGTPALFVNKEPIPGAVPFEDFVDSSERQREGMKSIIERHLK